MNKYLLIFLVFSGFVIGKAQELTSPQLLQKTIAYHDPNGLWGVFQGKLSITMSTPDGKERLSEVEINLPGEYFKLTSTKDNIIIEQVLNKEECLLKLNGSTTISEEDIKTHKLSCERANLMKNYYTYLYGLPMKLKDQGTLMDPKVYQKTFKGKMYKVLKVTYKESVGNDTWYFYFDPETYAMEVYQFYHNEEKNDGEYIILSGQEEINGIKMPKIRAWYYNKDDTYLGTDTLTKISAFKD
jgi:hypothetical protein